MTSVLVDDVEIGGRAAMSVLAVDGVVAAVGPAVEIRARAPGPVVVVAGGGHALLPGLHDHHVHLFALASRGTSVWCGPPDLLDRLRQAGGDGEGWIRAVGWDDAAAGWPDRHVLDTAVAARPLRLQHRSGAAWVLNSVAIDLVRPGPGRRWPPGAELDESGVPTGRFFGLDAWLRERVGAAPPSLAAASRELAARGVTGVTDAGATNDADALDALGAARERGELAQCVVAMTGSAAVTERPGVTLGCVKLVLAEASPPALADVACSIRAAHDAGRRVGIHVADRTSLVLAVVAFEDAGAAPGDRIEHASVAPPELVPRLAHLGLTVVTQHDFLRVHGDRYLATVEAAGLPWLYRGRAFVDAGIPLAGGSDAPFGGPEWPDPWQAMDSAVRRRSAAGVVLDEAECLDPEEALRLFTGAPEMPGEPRAIVAGAPADLCLLDRTWTQARRHLADVGVRATLIGGRIVFESDERRPAHA